MESLSRKVLIVRRSSFSMEKGSPAQLQFRHCRLRKIARCSSLRTRLQCRHLIQMNSLQASEFSASKPISTLANSNPLVSNALNFRDSQQSGTNGLYISMQEKKMENFGISKLDLASEMPVQHLVDLPKMSRHSQTELAAHSAAEKQRHLEVLAGWRHGRLLGDNVFRQTIVIRSYEVGAEKSTSIETLISLFQETALNHVSLLGIAGEGFGATIEMNRKRLIWVIARLHVEVERYPCWAEVVEIDTWVGAAGKNGMRRDWVLRDRSMGHILGRGTSTWVMIHQETRKLAKIPDEVTKEISRVFIEKHAFEDANVEKILKLDNRAQSIRSNLTSSRKDLDVNQHVNNVKYIDWAMESIPTSTFETHKLLALTLEYRRECNRHDVVESLGSVEFCSGCCSSSASSNSNSHSHSHAQLQPQSHLQSPTQCACVPNCCFLRSGMVSSSQECFPPLHQQQSQSPAADMHYIHLLRMQGTREEIVRGRSFWSMRRCPSRSHIC